MQFYYSIGPKNGTSVAPPSKKLTEHGLSGVIFCIQHQDAWCACHFWKGSVLALLLAVIQMHTPFTFPQLFTLKTHKSYTQYTQ